jgi:hypothetical protein
MKKNLIIIALFLLFSLDISAQQAYEYKIITTVESIVPMGVGRSRIVEAGAPLDYQQATSVRNEENHFKNNKTKRKGLKISSFNETKLLNFYSMVGINFQNIASNDALISSKLTDMSKNGWELFTVASGVESDAGKNDGKGIFITRYVFRRPL